MGLFDNLAGAVLGKLGGEQGNMAQAAMEMFNQNGGLSGILEKLKASGFAEQAASWVGTGENLPISAEQISSALGDGAIAEMAAKFGITPEELSSKIAQYLPVIVDKTIAEINVDDYDALAMPGGFGEFGFYEEAYDERFLKLIAEFNTKGKIIAAICSGAMPLGKSGVLKDRKATTYHLKNGYWQKKLKEFGVNVVNEPIVIDDNIITSYCPETAPKVAFELLKMLTSEEEMEVIKKAMGF